MPLIPIINPSVSPHNIYSRHRQTDLTLSGNTIIDKREWFNSFLPDLGLKQNNVSQLLDNLNKFFYFEEKLLELVPQATDLVEYSAILYLNFNLTQAYMDPVEAISNFKGKQPSSQIASELNRYFCLEAVFFPLSVVQGDCYSQEYQAVSNKTSQMMFCSVPQLYDSLTHIRNIYRPQKFMTADLAIQIILQNYNKINIPVNPHHLHYYQMSHLSSLISWSKYINHRFQLTNQAAEKLLTFPDIRKNKKFCSFLQPKTMSGSEKYGILIFALDYLFTYRPGFKESVIARALQINTTLSDT